MRAFAYHIGQRRRRKEWIALPVRRTRSGQNNAEKPTGAHAAKADRYQVLAGGGRQYESAAVHLGPCR